MTWILPPRERVASPHFYPNRLGHQAILLILHYAVDGDQSEDDSLDYNFLPRERSHDCMDVARGFAKRKRRASTHFVAGRDGSKVQCVQLKDACWGAGDGGRSKFPYPYPVEPPCKLSELPRMPRVVNCISTQIEVCNAGYAVDKLKIPKDERVTLQHPAMSKPREWEVFTDYAYRTTELLAAMLRQAQPTLRYVCGHEDVTNRDTLGQKYGGKFDPGPAWDWRRTDWSGLGYERVRYDFDQKMFVIDDLSIPVPELTLA